MPVTAEHQQPAGIVHHHFAERVDRIRRELFGRKGGGVVAFAAAIEESASLRVGDDARARVDDQPAALIDDIGVTPRMIRRIAVLTLRPP
jgi:hypothetical protein